MTQASDRVESWRETESHGFGIDFPRTKVGSFDECAETNKGGGLEARQSELGDDPVLVDERDDIGDGSE